jgi:hypothetical protein
VNNSHSGALCEEVGSDAWVGGCSGGAEALDDRAASPVGRRREHEGAPVDRGQPVRPFASGRLRRDLDVYDVLRLSDSPRHAEGQCDCFVRSAELRCRCDAWVDGVIAGAQFRARTRAMLETCGWSSAR